MNHAGGGSSSSGSNNHESDNNGDNEEDDDDDSSSSVRSGSDSSGSGGGGRLTLEDGLSAETLRALLAFRLGDVRASAASEEQEGRGGFGDNDMYSHREDSEGEETAAANAAASKDAICVAYTAKDSLVIAQTLKRLQERAEQDNQKSMKDIVMPHMRDIPSLQDPTTTTAAATTIGSEPPDADNVQLYLEALQRDGVVRINQVLALEACDVCLALINRALDEGGAEASTVPIAEATTATDNDDNEAMEPDAAAPSRSNPVASYGYGNVFSRKHRYDMYLHPSNEVYAGALRELLHHHDSALGRLFQRLLVEKISSTTPESADVEPLSSEDSKGRATSPASSSQYRNGKECYFHEFSCLVSDPGSGHQPLHPDYTGLPPLFTVFVALQNVTTSMGPTVLVPTSHTFRNAGELMQSVDLSDPLSYRQAALRRGDCIVMDSRTYHMGAGNTSSSSSSSSSEGESQSADASGGTTPGGDGKGQRRALLYLTLRDPDHATADKDFPPNGSLFDYLKGDMKLSDYDGTVRQRDNCNETMHPPEK
jgi:Phytanoyl-CoA dioxygenase (PhyH)